MDVSTRRSGSLVALGFDLGSTNTKAVLIRAEPSVDVLAQAGVPTPPPHLVPAVLADLARTVTTDNPPPEAVGIASMAETGVPLDSSRRPLGGWIGWNAAQAGAQAAALATELSAREVFALTGTRLSAKTPLAVWRWLASSDPERWRGLKHWAGVADLACLALTGELVTDHTLAGRTAAYRLDGPAVGASRYDEELLSAAGLRPGQLPEVSTPVARLAPGSLPEWDACGIPAGTPVVVAGHDHAVGAWAAGVRRPGEVADSLGTAEAVYAVASTGSVMPAEPVRLSGMSLVRTVAGLPALLAGQPAAGGMVQWWLEHHAPDWDAAALTAAAGAATPSPGLFITPYPAGRQSPVPDPLARVAIHGRRGSDGEAELAWAVFEGLALQAAWMVRVQGELAGQPAGPIVALGGPAASNPVWMQAKSRHLPTLGNAVSAGEPVASGAALFALHAIGASTSTLPTNELPVPEPAGPEALNTFIAAATADRPGDCDGSAPADRPG